MSTQPPGPPPPSARAATGLAEPVVLLAGRIQVWVARFPAGHLDAALRAALGADLDTVTRARVDRYRTPQDRDRGLAAHALLRRLLGSVVGEQPARLRIGTWCAQCRSQEHGKPFLTGWGEPPPVQFNVSHSGDLVAVALAGPGVEVGVDVESLARPVDWGALRRSVFTDAEWELTAAGPDPARARAGAWSRKEACVKATGRGLATPLRRVHVTHQPADPGQSPEYPGGHSPGRPGGQAAEFSGGQGPVRWRARIEAAGRDDESEDSCDLDGWDIAAAAGVADDHVAAVAVRNAPAGSSGPGPGRDLGAAPIVHRARL